LSKENLGEQKVWGALGQKKFNILAGASHENEGLVVGGRVICKPENKFVVM
jgi:hypothetical protein